MLFPKEIVSRLRHRVGEDLVLSDLAQQIINRAAWFLERTDHELWLSVPSPTIERSWMVRSDGACPSCGKPTPMYSWVIDARHHPWKVACPHCHRLFPDNDFASRYLAGLDESGVYRHELAAVRADDPETDTRLEYVDTGAGCLVSGNTYRFVSTALVYGQWKQLVVGGVRSLSEAWLVTGDSRYAHKALVLLDRVAELYPDFDFATQGFVYEQQGSSGYVSIWHDAEVETKELATAIAAVIETLDDDRELIGFLRTMRERFPGISRKPSAAEVRTGIVTGLIEHPIEHRNRIISNFPRMHCTVILLEALAEWIKTGSTPDTNTLIAALTPIVELVTAADGVTGEKGLANYTAFVIRDFAAFLGLFSRTQSEFLPRLFSSCPSLARTWRFHIDTWCIGEFYPLVGDTGYTGARYPEYQGIVLPGGSDLSPHPGSFLLDLYRATGDCDYLRILDRYERRNGPLPPDPFRDFNPDASSRAELLSREGYDLTIPSVDLEAWHLAILRGGSGVDARAVWIDYDAGGNHSHDDALNLGFFAMGTDLLPDFGYPPVQYGGWSGEAAAWYRSTAAHNTVLVDDAMQFDLPAGPADHLCSAPYRHVCGGVTRFRLFADWCSLIGIDASALRGGRRFERIVWLVSVDRTRCYVVDLAGASGGQRHLRMFHTNLCDRFNATGLDLRETTEEQALLPGMISRVRTDSSPHENWWIDFELREGPRLRLTDLSECHRVLTGEAWLVVRDSPGFSGTTREDSVPVVAAERRADSVTRVAVGESPQGGLSSDFIMLLEPWRDSPGGSPPIVGATVLNRRERFGDDGTQGAGIIRVELDNGDEDLVYFSGIHRPDHADHDSAIITDATAAVIRRHRDGGISVAATDCSYLRYPGIDFSSDERRPTVSILGE